MNAEVILSLIIGRYVFNITEADRFLDNGACTQIVTRSIPSGSDFPRRPILNKESLKQIELFEKVIIPNDYGHDCILFSLKPTLLINRVIYQ